MLKTISAALVAVSVLAAPALAGTPGKTAQAPREQDHPGARRRRREQGKAKVLNANARMGRHHKHYRHHRHHKHIGLHKTHAEAHRGQAHDAGRQTRLNLIRRRAFRPHCPARASRMSDQPTRHLLC